MKKILYLILFCGGNIYGQVPVEKDTINEIEKQTIGIISSADTVNIDVKTSKKEGTLFLKDHSGSEKYDSAWLRELSDNNPYKVLYQDIQAEYLSDISYDELPTELLKARLEKLDQKSLFHIEYNPILERVIKSFLKNRRASLTRLLTISQYYFPMFEQELDKQKIPLELKYLPIIESALNPRATSPAGAKGLWQFMYYTGKMYDLNVSNYVDERGDPILSTKAAAQFLKKLYGVYGDWDLVLAAYNSGPGNVNKAIRRSGGKTNYWNIRPYLPRETAGYVPAFLATLYIFEYAQQHGLKPEKRDNLFFETDTIRVKKNVPFSVIAPALGMEVEELEFLNPSYKMNIVPYVHGKDYALRLPIEMVGKFVNNEEAIYSFLEAQENNREKPMPSVVQVSPNQARGYAYHKVRKGDTLGKIAAKYGMTINSLKKLNKMKSNRLTVGKRLKVRKR